MRKKDKKLKSYLCTRKFCCRIRHGLTYPTPILFHEGKIIPPIFVFINYLYFFENGFLFSTHQVDLIVVY